MAPCHPPSTLPKKQKEVLTGVGELWGAVGSFPPSVQTAGGGPGGGLASSRCGWGITGKPKCRGPSARGVTAQSLRRLSPGPPEERAVLEHPGRAECL